jgi:hypothetical protein
MKESRLIAIVYMLFVVLVVILLFIQPCNEARTYNRLIGSNVTWWDALWVQLRVQGQPKE